ncbi:MAG: hypothetical protein QXI19_15180 [Candidatus Caldarchaeum sp.]
MKKQKRLHPQAWQALFRLYSQFEALQEMQEMLRLKQEELGRRAHDLHLALGLPLVGGLEFIPPNIVSWEENEDGSGGD